MDLKKIQQKMSFILTMWYVNLLGLNVLIAFANVLY